MGTFNVKHGGIIRKSFVISASETNAWSKGRVMRMDASGQLNIHNGGAALLTGITGENRVLSTNVGPTVTLNKIGAPNGEQASIIIDEAVIVDDQIRSGINFEAGDVVYTDTAGRLTTSGNGTGSNAPTIGIALSQGRSGDGARPVEFFFSVSY